MEVYYTFNLQVILVILCLTHTQQEIVEVKLKCVSSRTDRCAIDVCTGQNGKVVFIMKNQNYNIINYRCR